jgi:uncharacterized membrane protein YjjB (DUF3815 family)
MKGIFGLVGLLVALAIVGVVVKKQLDTSSQRVPALAPAVPGGAASAPATTVREQSQQVQQQYKQAVEGLMQQPRPMQDEK